LLGYWNAHHLADYFYKNSVRQAGFDRKCARPYGIKIAPYTALFCHLFQVRIDARIMKHGKQLSPSAKPLYFSIILTAISNSIIFSSGLSFDGLFLSRCYANK
jgi:hypothetical protein